MGALLVPPNSTVGSRWNALGLQPRAFQLSGMNAELSLQGVLAILLTSKSGSAGAVGAGGPSILVQILYIIHSRQQVVKVTQDMCETFLTTTRDSIHCLKMVFYTFVIVYVINYVINYVICYNSYTKLTCA